MVRGAALPLCMLAIAAIAGQAGSVGRTHTGRGGRVARQAAVIVAESETVTEATPSGGASGGGMVVGAEGMETAEWQALWAGALAALGRAPELNTTDEYVTVQLGGVAYLHCPVKHLGERGVSWVRRRDWHIISSGLFMYTNDERFQVLHSEGSDDWTLQIKYVQKRDNGTYSCQVPTGGGSGAGGGELARLVHLSVAEPEAFILGAGEHHVDLGSDISLVCIIDKSPVPPQYVFWYHNERMINYDSSRGVAVRTEPGTKTQSTLSIRRAAPAHSGNYSCRAPNTEPAHILVYVEQGSDKMAATLSRGNSAPPPAPLAARLLAAAALLAATVARPHL